MTRPKYATTGRPPGTPTFYWTDEERALVQATMDDVAKKLPHRTVRAIIGMMLRLESGDT